MRRLQLDKHKIIKLSVLVGALLVCVVAALLLASHIKKKKNQPVIMETLLQDTHYFPSDTEFTPEALFDGRTSEIRLVYGKAEMKLYRSRDGVFYVDKPEKEVNVNLPVYQKNGATLYLPEAVEYRLFTSDFSVVQDFGPAWISYGGAFNTENVRGTKKTTFLVDFKNGIYVNSIPFEVRGFQKETVPANSLLQVQDDRILLLEFADGLLTRREIKVTGQTMIAAEDIRISYYNLYKFCEDAKSTETPVVSNNGMELAGDYYYYFMGQRYRIEGPCMLYETKEGLFLENEQKAFLLPDAPIYEEDGDRIFLPRNYMLYEINQRQYCCLPFTTEVTKREEATYVSYKDTTKAYQQALLHDGEEHYVTLCDTTFRLGDVELLISAFSTIFISDNMEICFYQYDSEEYFTFHTAGKMPKLELPSGDVILLYDRLIERKDGTLDLLQKDPAVFPVIH